MSKDNRFRRTIPPRRKSWKEQPWAKDVGMEHSIYLDNAEDDKIPVTLQFAVQEAEYALSTYTESGHMAAEELNDPTTRKYAQEEIRALKAFIRKYKHKIK